MKTLNIIQISKYNMDHRKYQQMTNNNNKKCQLNVNIVSTVNTIFTFFIATILSSVNIF